jgi:hypothetical protein
LLCSHSQPFIPRINGVEFADCTLIKSKSAPQSVHAFDFFLAYLCSLHTRLGACADHSHMSATHTAARLAARFQFALIFHHHNNSVDMPYG